MMEEVVLISEGCRMPDGVGEAGEALLLRRRLVHLCGGMLRLTGGDHHRVVCFGVFFYLRSTLFMIMILTVLYL
jgi:hypothetical protein